jgi:hypothetical protein
MFGRPMVWIPFTSHSRQNLYRLSSVMTNLPSQSPLLGSCPPLQTPSFPSPSPAMLPTPSPLTTRSLSPIASTSQTTPHPHHGLAFEQVSLLRFVKSVGVGRVLTKHTMTVRVVWHWDIIIARLWMSLVLTISSLRNVGDAMILGTILFPLLPPLLSSSTFSVGLPFATPSLASGFN